MATVATIVPTDVTVETKAEPLANATATVLSNHRPAEEEWIRGTIARRRKYRDNISLAIRKPQTETGGQPQPPELVMIPRSDPNLDGCFLGTLVEVLVEPPSREEEPAKHAVETKEDESTQGNNNNNKKKNTHRSARSIKILRSSPDPNAIQECLNLVSQHKLPIEIFSCEDPLGGGKPLVPLVKDAQQAGKIMSRSPKDPLRRAFVNRISAGLKGEPMEAVDEDGMALTIRPRKRQSHIKARQRKILEKMEASQSPLDPIVVSTENNNSNMTETPSNNDDETDSAPSPHTSLVQPPSSQGTMLPPNLTYNLPDPNDATMMSIRHPKTRREYLHDKKWPQIRWLLQRLIPILQHLREQKKKQQEPPQTKETDWIEILDVGGGRGDLAVAVAEAFSDVRVTVVDLNESSLEGGRAYYQSRKPAEEVEDRVLFVCGDFAEYAKSAFESQQPGSNSNLQKRFDVVTAWHACGDLSDYALEFAVKDGGANANAFVICPCCYTKRYIESFEPKWIGDYYKQQQQQQQCIPCSTPPVATAAVEPRGNDDTVSSNGNTNGNRNNNNKSNSDNEIRTVQKLAEINERVEISQRAMGLINTMRLRSLLDLSSSQRQQQQQQHEQQDPTFDITLEEYDLSFSSKNLVLVGVKK